MTSTKLITLGLCALAGLSIGHGDHDHEEEHLQEPFIGWTREDLDAKWGTDVRHQSRSGFYLISNREIQWGFSGISTFAHLEHSRCLQYPDTEYDIAILGAPFDTAVTYRPGARFGPKAIRSASARQTAFRGYNPRADLNPYTNWAKIIDCKEDHEAQAQGEL